MKLSFLKTDTTIESIVGQAQKINNVQSANAR